MRSRPVPAACSRVCMADFTFPTRSVTERTFATISSIEAVDSLTLADWLSIVSLRLSILRLISSTAEVED